MKEVLVHRTHLRPADPRVPTDQAHLLKGEPPPRNRDYHRDPNIKARKRRAH